MTDPATKVEIEDVLSSIRRLVSEKARTDAPSDSAERTVELKPRPAPVGKLVLTAALRVAEPEEKTVEKETLVVEPDEPDVVAEVTEAVLEELAFVRQNRAPEAAADAEPISAEVELADDGLSDESESLFNALPELDQPEATEQAETTEEAQAEPDPVADDDGDLPQEVVVSRVAGDLEERIARWEVVVANADGDYEPSTAGEDDYAGTEVESLPWQDHSDPVKDYQDNARWADAHAVEDAEETEDDEDDVVEAMADDLTAQDQNMFEDAYIDEAALRDLVGQIVREELQGALGERITRNVRKLVRREIHRALSANALD